MHLHDRAMAGYAFLQLFLYLEIGSLKITKYSPNEPKQYYQISQKLVDVICHLKDWSLHTHIHTHTHTHTDRLNQKTNNTPCSLSDATEYNGKIAKFSLQHAAACAAAKPGHLPCPVCVFLIISCHNIHYHPLS